MIVTFTFQPFYFFPFHYRRLFNGRHHVQVGHRWKGLSRHIRCRRVATIQDQRTYTENQDWSSQYWYVMMMMIILIIVIGTQTNQKDMVSGRVCVCVWQENHNIANWNLLQSIWFMFFYDWHELNVIGSVLCFSRYTQINYFLCLQAIIHDWFVNLNLFVRWDTIWFKSTFRPVWLLSSVGSPSGFIG